MGSYLGIDGQSLKDRNSYWTAREISQQPHMWRAASEQINQQRQAIDEFIQPLLATEGVRIILTGAGTSAFVGESLAPWLRKQLDRRVEAISTTDIVAAPDQYLQADVPTLVVSFARSGDSPESVATVNLATQLVNNCHHLVITCNPDGYLAKASLNDPRIFCLLMPEGTNDKSFAMTSSFTSMLFSCATVFAPDHGQLEVVATATETLLQTQRDTISTLAQQDIDRLVVLGAGNLLGIAREASLKCLELTAGKMMVAFDSPLGFRHGPKSMVNEKTLIVVMHSSDAYVGRYDRDLQNELLRDQKTTHVVELSPQSTQLGAKGLTDLGLSLLYIAYCQAYAFYRAWHLGIGADNPCPTGEVNRVVKGVEIYPFTAE
ncbi:MAG: SIS domain-containing protein [Porticoccaceae bacterium]|nr:SIS domain-containing protein [Porticoccaceae bacterium]